MRTSLAFTLTFAVAGSALAQPNLTLPEDSPRGTGLGLRIMAHRAAMIGGTISVEPAPAGGTMVTCSFPNRPTSSLKPQDNLKP